MNPEKPVLALGLPLLLNTHTHQACSQGKIQNQTLIKRLVVEANVKK